MSKLDELLNSLTQTEKQIAALEKYRKENNRSEEEDFLYHYTDAGGLLGILGGNRKNLRLTDARYLNDSTELLHAFDLSIEYLESQVENLWALADPEVAELMMNKRAEFESQLRGPKQNSFQYGTPLRERFIAEFLDTNFSSINNFRNFYRNMLEEAEEKMQRVRRFGRANKACYVACFSENRDQLSQWRGYCPNGGYSLGVSARKLTEASDGNFVLIKCKYSKNEKFAYIEAVLKPYLDITLWFIFKKAQIEWEYRNLSEGEQDDDPGYFYGEYDQLDSEIAGSFGLIAPLLKHEKFDEEAEWRLVNGTAIWGHGRAEHPESVKFRARGSLIVPYVELDLDESILQRGLHVTVGPTNNSKEALLSTRDFLNSTSSNYSNHSVVASEIPFRTG